jgi:HEAT repeat protein
MGSAGQAAVPALADAASAKRLEIRQAAVGALGRLDPDTRAFAALHRALKDPDPRLRGSAAFAVSRLSASARPAVADLGQMLLDDRAEEVRRAAAEGLARLGPEAKLALPSLVKALGDKDVDMRRQVALALSKLGPDAKAALPVLKEALADPDRFVRCHAIRALGGLVKEEPAVIGLLASCLKQDTVDVRLAALEELGQSGPLAKAAESAVKGALTDNRAVVREAAAEALKKIQAGP